MPDDLTKAGRPTPRSAFAEVAPDGLFERPGVIRLRDPGHRPKTLLRVRLTPAWSAAAESVLGVAPPDQPGTPARSPVANVLWLGPDEWLVLGIGPASRSCIGLGSLAPALLRAGLAAAEVGDGLPDLELSGPRAREILAGGAALDLHPTAFPAGRATRTRLGRIGVLLQRAEDSGNGPVFRLHVERPWAGHLWSWLADAALDHPSNDESFPR
ncbi:sarcosine oxidase subunit gamma (plasmid) [Azospirillum sp. TSH58]|uniref:sarcosine oxidase subunit gamma n=1 Tax=Azospirillum sp. TSH58 TaxID=664962 RepID=UPI000D5FEDC8|nr:sarcosine oxidase subunit gamma family protein [Azospirillum sp. TSH58]AWJ87835.1 sarcosine oxidase subunit gamma [Azospirillum sp. TSH58]